jgi:hypothetical protein
MSVGVQVTITTSNKDYYLVVIRYFKCSNELYLYYAFSVIGSTTVHNGRVADIIDHVTSKHSHLTNELYSRAVSLI